MHLDNSLDKDHLSEEGIPKLPILTRVQHRRFIEEQRTIIRTLIRDSYPEQVVYYTIFNTSRIIYNDALVDILGVQHVIYEIIFNQRSRTNFVLYIRNLPKGTFTLLWGEQDDILEGPPQYDLDGNKIHTDKESD